MNCPTCQARGLIRCQNCAASGSIACKPCAGSGWLSNITHIEVYGKVNFNIDGDNFTPSFAHALEEHKHHCIEKHDIEADILPPDMEHEPEDTIHIDYAAMTPYGSLVFAEPEKEISGNLFGYQCRLKDFPAFVDEYSQQGQETLINFYKNKSGNAGSILHKAAEFAYLKELITQSYRLKNKRKVYQIMLAKYTAGIDHQRLQQLINAADYALKHITRYWRIAGMMAGAIFFAFVGYEYFLNGGWDVLRDLSLTSLLIKIIDISLLPIGILTNIYAGKLASVWIQRKTLESIIPKEFLGFTLPKAGKTFSWSIGLILVIYIGLLVAGYMMNTNIPAWAESMLKFLPLKDLSN